MFHLLVVLLFGWALMFFHSCSPENSQRNGLSLARATDDIVKDYTDAYSYSAFFQSNTKRCPHCGKLVEIDISVGECMFRELAQYPPDSPEARKLFPGVRRQLRGEAADGYTPANCLLGMISENGLYGMRQDVIAAARYYRLAADSGTSRGRAALACFWIRLGENLVSAVDLLKKALADEPRNTEYYLYLSQAYALQHKYKDALQMAKTAYYHSPVNSTERAAIEQIFVERIMFASAELGFDVALAEINDLIYLSPKNPDILLARANLYASFDRLDAAEKEFTRLVVAYPDTPVIRLARAQFRVFCKEFAGAHEDVKVLLEKYPADTSVRGSHLMLLMDEKREQEAFDTVRSYIEREPESADPYFLRAQLFLRKNNLKEALADYVLVRRFAGASPELDAVIASLREAVKKQSESTPAHPPIPGKQSPK